MTPPVISLDNLNGHTCGDVQFQRHDASKPDGWAWADDIIGGSRVETLRKFYRGADLGDLRPYVQGHGVITRHDVYWRTCGARVYG